MKNENDDTDEIEADQFGNPVWLPLESDGIPPAPPERDKRGDFEALTETEKRYNRKGWNEPL